MQKFVLIILIVLSFLSVSAQTETDNLNQASAIQESQKISAQAVKLFKEKKFDEALPLAQKAVSIRENALGKNHPLVAQAWRNLAYIQLQRGERKDAEKAFKKAFEIYEKSPSLSAADEKMYAEMLESVAVYEALDTDIKGAEKKLKRAVELNEKVNGAEALETASALLKLAQIYQITGDFEKAAPLLLRALNIRNAKLGTTNDQTREAYQNAFCTLTKLERKDEVEELIKNFNPQIFDPTKVNKNSTVSGGVVNSKALNLVKPPYPYEARSKRAGGAVNVQVTIDETGNVIYACALSGAKELQRTSEIAAYQSKFAPTLINGQAVKITGVIVYNYVP